MIITHPNHPSKSFVWCYGQFEAVMTVIQAKLATKPRVFLRAVENCQQVLFIHVLLLKFIQPFLVKIYMTGATCAQTTTNGRHAPLMSPQGLHQGFTFAGLYFVGFAVEICGNNIYQSNSLK